MLRGTGQTPASGAIGFFAKQGGGGSRAVGLYDLAIVGEVRERTDGQPVQGIGVGASGRLEQNVYIQHTKVGLWLDGPGDGLVVSGNVAAETRRMGRRDQRAHGMEQRHDCAQPVPQHGRRRHRALVAEPTR